MTTHEKTRACLAGRTRVDFSQTTPIIRAQRFTIGSDRGLQFYAENCTRSSPHHR
jgi:hypothetical protein